jgi:hypothetical protein
LTVDVMSDNDSKQHANDIVDASSAAKKDDKKMKVDDKKVKVDDKKKVEEKKAEEEEEDEGEEEEYSDN